jgi:flagellar protein FlaJ
MYEWLSNFYPKNLKENYIKILTYAQIKIPPKRFLGFVLSFGVLLALAVSLMLSRMVNMPVFLIGLLSFLLFQFIIYFAIMMRVDSKAKFVDLILPDVLQLMASNLRAGLTIDKAFILSARPEFGPFQEEIDRVGKEITMGKELEDSLLELKDRIKSEKLEKTMLLIVAGLRSGGQLANLLEQTAKNLRDQKFIDEKIKTHVMMYVIFIFVAVGFGSPLLFGLSSVLVEVLTKTLSSVVLPETTTVSSMPITFGRVSISLKFILTYSIISLIMTSIMGSMVIGLINKGKKKEGVKYMPLLIGFTIGLFFLVRTAMRGFVGGLFNL